MNNEEKHIAGMLRAAGPYLTLGLQIAMSVLLFLYLGMVADDAFNTKPWLMVAGLVIGFTGGMIHFFRSVIELSKKEEDERKKNG